MHVVASPFAGLGAETQSTEMFKDLSALQNSLLWMLFDKGHNVDNNNNKIANIYLKTFINNVGNIKQ